MSFSLFNYNKYQLITFLKNFILYITSVVCFTARHGGFDGMEIYNPPTIVQLFDLQVQRREQQEWQIKKGDNPNDQDEGPWTINALRNHRWVNIIQIKPLRLSTQDKSLQKEENSSFWPEGHQLHSLNPLHMHVCVECGNDIAVFVCRKCGDPLCTQCQAQLHAKGRRQTHKSDIYHHILADWLVKKPPQEKRK